MDNLTSQACKEEDEIREEGEQRNKREEEGREEGRKQKQIHSFLNETGFSFQTQTWKDTFMGLNWLKPTH